MSRIERWLRRIIREELEADHGRRQRRQRQALDDAFRSVITTGNGRAVVIQKGETAAEAYKRAFGRDREGLE